MKVLNLSHLDGVTGGRYFSAWPGYEDQPKGWFTHTCPTAKAVKKVADKAPFMGMLTGYMRGTDDTKARTVRAISGAVAGVVVSMVIDDNVDDFYDYYGLPKG